VIGSPKSYDSLPAIDEWPALIQEFTAQRTAMEETKS